MQEVTTGAITLRQAQELFGPLLSNHQSDSGARLVTLELHELGFQISWYVAPRNHYLFFVPRYRSSARWQKLSAWYRSFFDAAMVSRVKAFARQNKWSVTTLPILSGLNVEAVSGFGSKFQGWNDLVEVEQYVLPLKAGCADGLRDYLLDWERVLAPYVFRRFEEGISPVIAAVNSDLSLGLTPTPMTTTPDRVLSDAKKSTRVLSDVLSRWSEADVVQALHMHQTFPNLLRLNMMPSSQITDKAKVAWEAVYDLRVSFLEKFPLPWFYEGLIDSLGAETERWMQSASQIVEEGAPPVSKPVVPAELYDRVARVALTIERKYPILLAKSIERLAV